MSKLILDANSFRDTAEALLVINPRGHTSADGILRYMEDSARRTIVEFPNFQSYVSTAGWELCFWKDDNGDTNVRASVMAYSVLRFLKDREIKA